MAASCLKRFFMMSKRTVYYLWLVYFVAIASCNKLFRPETGPISFRSTYLGCLLFVKTLYLMFYLNKNFFLRCLNLRLFLDPQRFHSKTRGIACLLQLALPPTKTIVQSDPPPTSVRKEFVVASPMLRGTQRRRTPARGCELPLAHALHQDQ